MTLVFCCFAQAHLAHGDIVLKTKTTKLAKPPDKDTSSITTIKQRGEWRRWELDSQELKELPWMSEAERLLGTVSLTNLRTGEKYAMMDGKFVPDTAAWAAQRATRPGKKATPPSAPSPPVQQADSKTAPPTSEDMRSQWEDTGKSEMRAGYQCRIHIHRIIRGNEVVRESKLWITRDLKHLEPLQDQLQIPPGKEQPRVDAEKPAGIVIREEMEAAVFKMMPKGLKLPPLPDNVLNEKSRTVTEFISLEGIDLPASEFEVAGAGK